MIVSLILVLPMVLQASAVGKPARTNGELQCPKSKTVTLHWLPYGRDIYMNKTSGNATGKLAEFLEYALKFCCPTLKFNYSPMKVESSKDIELSIRNDKSVELSLYFPVFANKYQKEKYQRPFIGIFDSPGPIIFVNEKSPKNGAVFTAMTKSWQIPALCVLLAAISGVILWFLDHKNNKKEFPQEFHRGSCVGLWWAFVTMTTVGYGDIAPKSFQGRLFAVLWMIIGTIALTLFNAQLTALITSNEIPTELVLIGRTIIIPRGGKPFMEQELNLGAEYQEEDFETIFQKVRDKTEEILLMYNYDDIKLAQNFAKANGLKTNIKVIRTLDHRFTIGVTASGNVSQSDSFLRCIEREVVDKIVTRKAQIYKQLSAPLNKPKPTVAQNNEPRYEFETMATFVACSVLVLLVALGLVLEFCGKRETAHGMRGEPLTKTEENWYKERSWLSSRDV